MSNVILLCMLILGILLSNMSTSKSRGRGMHGVSKNATGTPSPRQMASGKKSSKMKRKFKQRRQQVAGGGAGGAQLNFEEEEDTGEWHGLINSIKEYIEEQFDEFKKYQKEEKDQSKV